MADLRRRRPIPTQTCRLRLFVAGEGPNSRTARENLERWRQRLEHWQVEVQVVDVNADAALALANRVFVTPALQVLEPPPGGLLYGDLSDAAALTQLVQRPRAID